VPTVLLPAYEEWLERLEATYRSVAFCSVHRLGDRALAEQVSAQVVEGLIAKPQVFRYWGLPYSGRIAHLAEALIAQAREGTLREGQDWPTLLTGLRGIPVNQQEVFVLACVEGHDDARLASALSCDEAEARRRREQMAAVLARSAHAHEGD